MCRRILQMPIRESRQLVDRHLTPWCLIHLITGFEENKNHSGASMSGKIPGMLRNSDVSHASKQPKSGHYLPPSENRRH